MAINKFSHSELLQLPNCIDLSETGECLRLNISACAGEKCTFKRSAAEYNFLQVKAFQRLASLSNSKQTYISNKYYGGTKPWNEE